MVSKLLFSFSRSNGTSMIFHEIIFVVVGDGKKKEFFTKLKDMNYLQFQQKLGMNMNNQQRIIIDDFSDYKSDSYALSIPVIPHQCI
jgi:hypothetical protein